MHGFTHAAIGGGAAAGMLAAARAGTGEGVPNLPSEPTFWGWMGGLFVLGLVTHALFDMVPHNDEWLGEVSEKLIGVGVLALCFVVAASQLRWLILAGALGGAGPDLEHSLYKRGWIRWRLFPTHSGLWPHRAGAWPWSEAVQVVLFVLSLAAIRWLG